MRFVDRVARAITVAALGAIAGCGDSTVASRVQPIPAFVFVSSETGRDKLYVYGDGRVTPFPGSVDGDTDPQSAHGRVVFASLRAGETNSEIYSAKIDGSDVQRLTDNSSLDLEPSMSPDGTRVVYVNVQGGASRLWTMNADGSDPAALETGSDSHTLERMPRFSPDGSTVLFSSTRTGTSQLWAIAASGGTPEQLTHETNGAFDGSWGADASRVFYVAGLDFHTVHELDLATGTQSVYAVDSANVSEPECNAELCLVVSTVDGPRSEIRAYVGRQAAAPLTPVNGLATEREPAFLRP